MPAEETATEYGKGYLIFSAEAPKVRGADSSRMAARLVKTDSLRRSTERREQ
jgi:hypothetical protein